MYVFSRLFFLLTLCFCFNSQALTILIDPGHGGEDRGARTFLKKGIRKKQRIEEKDIALQLAQRIYKKLKKKYTVYLTRSVDRSVSLERRAEIADKIKADIFISIHANASKSTRAHGFETYYLDNHRDAAVNKVESIENRNLKGDALVVNQILIDLVIQQTAKESRSLADSIHQKVLRRTGNKYKLKNRGVKPGLFYVLALSKRPAVLLEVGFLSNQKELKKILSAPFQESYAQAVSEGIDLFVARKKKK